MGCCEETGCERSTPVLIRRSGLTGRFYAITRHHRTDGRIVADVKHDVTDEITALMDALAHLEVDV